MRFRWTISIGLLAAAGCHKLPLLAPTATPHAQTPVIVVPEPQIAVPVPLAPGETLVESEPTPYYLAPGVTPPPRTVLPTLRGPIVTPQAPRLDMLDRLGASGSVSPLFGLPRAPSVENRLPNPVIVPVSNPELAWDQIADVVSDFFPIAREQQVQFVDGVVTEGFIETATQSGATLLERQRPDSVGAFNRWQATFQTIRRRVLLSVSPTGQGWAISVQADKELEDLSQPLGATAGAATLRNDSALPTARLNDQLQTRSSGRWIPIGRDEPLEQELLARIQERLTGRAR